MRTIGMLAVMAWLGAAQAWAGDDPWSKSYALEANGNYGAAAAVIAPLAKEEGDRELVWLRLGWLHYLAGEYHDAIRAYRKALDLNPRSLEARLGLALPLMAQHRWREAMMYLDQVLAISPYHYLANLRMMACEEGLRRWDELLARAMEMHSRYPSDATVLIYMARAYAWQGKRDLARETYRKVLHRAPGNLEARRFLAR